MFCCSFARPVCACMCVCVSVGGGYHLHLSGKNTFCQTHPNLRLTLHTVQTPKLQKDGKPDQGLEDACGSIYERAVVCKSCSWSFTTRKTPPLFSSCPEVKILTFLVALLRSRTAIKAFQQTAKQKRRICWCLWTRWSRCLSSMPLSGSHPNSCWSITLLQWVTSKASASAPSKSVLAFVQGCDVITLKLNSNSTWFVCLTVPSLALRRWRPFRGFLLESMFTHCSNFPPEGFILSSMIRLCVPPAWKPASKHMLQKLTINRKSLDHNKGDGSYSWGV